MCCFAVFIINNLKTIEINELPTNINEPPVVNEGEILLYFNEGSRKKIDDNLEIEFNNLDEISEFFSNLPSDRTINFIIKISYTLYVDNEEYEGWQKFGISSENYINEESPFRAEIINFSFTGEWLIFKIIEA